MALLCGEDEGEGGGVEGGGVKVSVEPIRSLDSEVTVCGKSALICGLELRLLAGPLRHLVQSLQRLQRRQSVHVERRQLATQMFLGLRE